MSKGKITLKQGMDVKKILAAMKEAYKDEKITDIDGVKIDFADSWVHMRSSNTEPIIRVYSEAHDQESADRMTQRFIGEIEHVASGC